MGLPEVRKDNVAIYLSNADVVRETADQIMKDFGMFGVKLDFSGNTDEAYHELHQQLIRQVTRLLDNDFRRLLSVLYQIDISDAEIAKTALELPEYNHVEVLAHQIIVRDLKKVLTRHYFKAQQ